MDHEVPSIINGTRAGNAKVCVAAPPASRSDTDGVQALAALNANIF